MLGHVVVRERVGGRLVQEPSRQPESTDSGDVAAFLADLNTNWDRAIVLLMVLGGLRAAELLSLRLADVDMRLRRVRVVGKGNNERIVPVDDNALEAFDEWLSQRQTQRAQPHPRGGHLADFVFVAKGRRLGPTRINEASEMRSSPLVCPAPTANDSKSPRIR